MHFTLFTALAAPALVLAQYGAPPGNPATPASSTAAAAVPSPSISGQTIITVSPGGALAFSPNNITAKINDTITFVFPPGSISHSVTQSSFADPCNLLNEAGNGTIGFDSGLTSNDQFSLVITNASIPIWFHCKQFGPPSHCGSGMVGSINAPLNGTNTFAAFLAIADALGAAEPQDTSTGALVGLGASATGPASTPSASASPTTTPSSASHLMAGVSSLLIAFGVALSLL